MVDPKRVVDITRNEDHQALLKQVGNRDEVIERSEVDKDGDGYLDVTPVTRLWKEADYRGIQDSLIRAQLLLKKREQSPREAYAKALRALKEIVDRAPSLYDLSEPQTARIYEEVQKSQEPHTISTDETSSLEIQKAIKKAVSKYGGGGIVILEGAAVHTWGAIPSLVRNQSANYYGFSTWSLRVGLNQISRDPVSEDEMKIQMQLSLGVVRKIGYKTIEEFRTHNRPHDIPKNVIIGFEETGHHTLYANARSWERARIYFNEVGRLIQETNPSFVLIVGEDVSVKNVERSLKNPPITPEAPLWEFARRVQNSTPLIVAAFGR